MGAIDRQRGECCLARQGLARVLGQHVGDVETEAVDAAIGPEAKGPYEVRANVGVGPVQVGLLDGEVVEVPLPLGDSSVTSAFRHSSRLLRHKLSRAGHVGGGASCRYAYRRVSACCLTAA